MFWLSPSPASFQLTSRLPSFSIEAFAFEVRVRRKGGCCEGKCGDHRGRRGYDQSEYSERLGHGFPLGRTEGSITKEVDPLALPGGDSCAADRSAKTRLKPPP
jgi:hypothetical protein